MLIHRTAASNDFDAVFELYMELSANPFLTYDPMDKDDFETIFKKLLATNTLFVVESGNLVVATYRLIPKTDRQAHIVYLGGFTIRKDHQGQGIGAQVLEHIKAYALENQHSRIELTVDINNIPAISLYKKAGFLIEGQLRNNYKRSDTGLYYDEYLMGLVY